MRLDESVDRGGDPLDPIGGELRVDRQGDLFASERLRLGEVAFLVSQMRPGGEQVDRGRVVDSRTYAVFTQEGPGGDATRAADGVDVVDVPAPADLLGKPQSRTFPQELAIESRPLPPLLGPAGEAFQLDAQDRMSRAEQN